METDREANRRRREKKALETDGATQESPGFSLSEFCSGYHKRFYYFQDGSPCTNSVKEVGNRIVLHTLTTAAK